MTGLPVARGRAGRPPARGYKWEDAKPGNTIALKHGAYSPRVVDPLATELVNGQLALAEEDPTLAYLARPQYRSALWAWGRAEARVQVLVDFLDTHGTVDDDGNPRSALNALYRFETLAANHRSRLGLDPLSRARLGRDVAAGQFDVARLFASWAEESEEVAGISPNGETSEAVADGD